MTGGVTGGVQGPTASDIQSLYNSLIGRTGTADEVNAWLKSGKSISQMVSDFMDARNNSAAIQQSADLIKSGASQVTNASTWQSILDSIKAKATTTGTTTGGLLGETTTGGVKQTVTAADISNLYRNIIGSTADTKGMNFWLGKAAGGMDLATMEAEFRTAMTDPALLAQRAALIKSGEAQNVTSSTMPSGFTGFQSGIREVPFGGTVVGQNVTGPGPAYTAAMYAPSIQDAFLRSMQYQSQLPNMLPVFNPAATPSIYPQIAQELGRYNIAGAQVPSWLRVTTPTDANTLATARTTSTGE